jgi:xanthine dehydrogenase small subunit
MSLFTLYHAGKKPTRQEIVDHIAGNLCRCTGYRPIVDAAVKSCTGKPADAWVAAAKATAVQLAALNDAADIFMGDTSTFFAAPYHEEALTRLYADHPDATVVAGATDVGLQAASSPAENHPYQQDRGWIKSTMKDRIFPWRNATIPARNLSRLGDPDIGGDPSDWSQAGAGVRYVGGNIANGRPLVTHHPC